ncbi:hypothetical protein TURU_062557 [Turdus rufiventris]|nr:hypothetical protein TURU_062557 [Turdus rufiventris]
MYQSQYYGFYSTVNSEVERVIGIGERGDSPVDEGKPVDIDYLDYSKAFGTVSHSTLLEKLAAHGLDRSTLLD